MIIRSEDYVRDSDTLVASVCLGNQVNEFVAMLAEHGPPAAHTFLIRPNLLYVRGRKQDRLAVLWMWRGWIGCLSHAKMAEYCEE